MISGSELLFIVCVVVPLVSVTWGVSDASSHSDHAWEAAGQNKVLWIALQVAGLLAFGVGGFVVVLVYLVMIRPQLIRAEGRAR